VGRRAPRTIRADRAGRRARTPPRIAITGGIGSGKSAALDAFSRRGAAVLSADAVVHELLREPAVAQSVAERFGEGVLAPDGGVDRARLGSLAFAQPDGISFLEGLLHPLVAERREQWIATQLARVPAPPLLVCEIPLLYEAGAEEAFDAALVVTASEDVRKARVEARGQRFEERSGHQLSEDEKVRMADSAFVNDGTLAELEAWVDARFAEYAGPRGR